MRLAIYPADVVPADRGNGGRAREGEGLLEAPGQVFEREELRHRTRSGRNRPGSSADREPAERPAA
jgi:hypothetical protein